MPADPNVAAPSQVGMTMRPRTNADKRRGALLAGFESDPLPDGLPTGYERDDMLLVLLCQRLQRHAGDEPFFLSVRTAGELLDMSPATASRRLHALVLDDVLAQVSSGTPANRKASEFRFLLTGADHAQA